MATLLFTKSNTMQFDRDTIVQNNIIVPDSVTCVIKPGVSIRFSGYYQFVVRGLLIARGTQDAPIWFTCVDRPRGIIAPPCWYGLIVTGRTAHAYCAHCRFEGAFRNTASESSPSFDSCEFSGNHYALYCTKLSSPLVKSCRFSRNVYALVADNATPLLRDNAITDNTIGMYIQSGAAPLAGPNIITGNGTNIKAEESLAGDKSSLSTQQVWEIMNDLY